MTLSSRWVVGGGGGVKSFSCQTQLLLCQIELTYGLVGIVPPASLPEIQWLAMIWQIWPYLIELKSKCDGVNSKDVLLSKLILPSWPPQISIPEIPWLASKQFLARATVGTSLYVSLRQLVSQLVSQLVRFCFSKLILGYFQIMQGAEILPGSRLYQLAYIQPPEKLG